MFDVLIASQPPRQRTVGQAVISVVLHLFAVWGLIALGRMAPPVVDAARDAIAMVFLQPALEQKLAPPPEVEQRQQLVIVTDPPPQGFQTVRLTEIPTEIPPVDLTQAALDPRNFSGRGSEGGVFNGVVGGTGTVDLADAGAVGAAIYTEDQLDEPARVVSQPPLRYPPVLHAAGLTGVVQAQFVIDASGRVDSSTVRFLNESHELFRRSVLETLSASRFEPARLGGRTVRQLAQQRYTFKLTT